MMTWIAIVVFCALVALLAVVLYAGWQREEREEAAKRSRAKVRRTAPASGGARGQGDAPAQKVLRPALGKPAEESKALESKAIFEAGMSKIFSHAADGESESRCLPEIEHLSLEMGRVDESALHFINSFAATGKIYEAINKPDIDMKELSKYVVMDPSLSARVLKAANSPFFGIQHKVDSISHGLMILGLAHVKNILHYQQMSKMLRAKDDEEHAFIRALWRHATFTSIWTSHLQPLYPELSSGALFTAGLLHDIGKVIQYGSSAENRPAAGEPAEGSGGPGAIDAEDPYGLRHSMIGSLALKQWNLSEAMAKTVEAHHMPSFVDKEDSHIAAGYLKYLLVLFLANQLAKIYADPSNNLEKVDQLRHSYYSLIDRDRLSKLVFDPTPIAQLKKAEAVMESYF